MVTRSPVPGPAPIGASGTRATTLAAREARASGSETVIPRFVSVLAVVASAVLALAGLRLGLALNAWPYSITDAGFLLPAIGLVGLFIVLQRFAFHFEWAGHRVTANMDDVLVFLSFFVLPAPTPVIALTMASLFSQWWTRREPVKGVFNVAHDTISAGAAWGTFTLATLAGVPFMASALLTIPVFLATSNYQVAMIFARLEGTRSWHVYRERFLVTTFVVSGAAAASGVIIVGLWTLHPAALIVFAPFVYAARRYGKLVASVDRQVEVHRRLAAVTHDLVGTSDMDAVADRVLATCGTLVMTGRVDLRLEAHATGVDAREWSRTFTGGASHGSRGHAQAIPGRDGRPLGTLTVHPRPGTDGISEADLETVRVVAGATAAAVENARALTALEEARENALRTNEALAKQEKLSALGTLVAGVAHEIGNPLAYMKGSLELAMMDLDELAGNGHEEGARIREDVKMALDGVERLQEITLSLKDVAKPAAESRQDADLNAIAREVANVVRAGFPGNAALDLDLVADEEVAVHVNRGEITQIVLNLVKNAAEAIGDEQGHVTIRTRRKGDDVEVVVEDDGPGMPDDVQQKLFEAFFTTKAQGTGLGLNISHRIARQHGGDLSCSSALGAGTTFVLSLPFRAPGSSEREPGMSD